MNNIKFKILAPVAAAATLIGGAAIAQQPTTPPAQQTQPPSGSVSDTEVTQFVAANEKVNTIAADMNAELQSTESPEAASEVQAAAQEKMVSAIEEEGLTTTRFTEIAQLAQADPAVNEKIRAEMEG